LPKRNYGYEKRQKELTKQHKREEKRQRKLERAAPPADDSRPDEPGIVTQDTSEGPAPS
jgi:hypothetical protein